MKRAITRTPPLSFAEGLTAAGLGQPDTQLARRQHEAYVAALARCGLDVEVLPPVEAFPDSAFVEDTAVLFDEVAVLCRPAAASRRGEVATIAPAVRRIFENVAAIPAPARLDGGDVMVAGRTVFVGLSERTDRPGAEALRHILSPHGYEVLDIEIHDGLHLKSNVACLGDNDLVVAGRLADEPAFAGYQRIELTEAEAYAANCVRVNDTVLVPDGFPRARALIAERDQSVLAVGISEFQKMDGGISCLSLRF